MTLVPAYGKDYKGKKAVLEDFDKGVDFLIMDISSPYNGKYCNKQELVKDGIKSVNIRYSQLRSIAVVKLESERSSQPAGKMK